MNRRRAGFTLLELLMAMIVIGLLAGMGILKYIELRFRPQIRIDEAELQQAYAEQYAGRTDAPPLADVSKQLLEQLQVRALDKRIEGWVAELRAAARVRVNPEPPLK